jgi:uncharacterized membrane protein
VVFKISVNWFFGIIFLAGLWVTLPWLAPVFMRLGWEGPAEVIYRLYSFQCHQLPQRSFFLFGQQTMYSLTQLQTATGDTFDPLILRQFIGNAEMGYKVAWSDRMVSAYTSIPLTAIIWWPFRRRIRPVSLRGFFLLALPMLIDGSTHFVSDLTGIDQGFRYANSWLADLTYNSLRPSFYVGNTLGSFNSWMRLITGSLFGIGLVLSTFPILDFAFSDMTRVIKVKFARAGVEL